MWYIAKLLKKFLFISENLSDLYLTTKAFQVFVKALYSMDNYSGEPMVEELILRIRDVTAEMERFREIFEFTLDEEIEEELNAAEEEEAPQPL
jgi:DNA mismatch repair ATPase MutS